jgi:hypothetical protein
MHLGNACYGNGVYSGSNINGQYGDLLQKSIGSESAGVNLGIFGANRSVNTGRSATVSRENNGGVARFLAGVA